MAKTQNLSLNPTKISGTCGRLMCCLKYEQNVYEDAAKRMPKAESFVQTPDGPGNVKSVDLLRETVKVALCGGSISGLSVQAFGMLGLVLVLVINGLSGFVAGRLAKK